MPIYRIPMIKRMVTIGNRKVLMLALKCTGILMVLVLGLCTMEISL